MKRAARLCCIAAILSCRAAHADGGSPATATATATATVTAVRGGWVLLRASPPLRPGDRVALRRRVLRSIPAPDRPWRTVPGEDAIGVLEIERVDGDIAAGRPVRGVLAAPGDIAVPTAEPPRPALWAPGLPRRMLRVSTTVRPFLNLLDPGVGMASDLTVDYHLRAPLIVGVVAAPLLVMSSSVGTSVVSRVLLRAALASDYIELGGAAGARVLSNGRDGLALATSLRLGALDGPHVSVTIGYDVARNVFRGTYSIVLASAAAEIATPLSSRLTLFAEGGYGTGFWFYGNVGLRHYLRGNGGPGTFILSGSLGGAGLLDRLACLYAKPDACTTASWGFGPVVGVGAEWRL